MVPRIGSPPFETVMNWDMFGENTGPPPSLVVTRLGAGDKRAPEVECETMLCPDETTESPVKRKRARIEPVVLVPKHTESAPVKRAPAEATLPYNTNNAWTIFPDLAGDAFYRERRRADPPVFALERSFNNVRIISFPDWRDAAFVAGRVCTEFDLVQRSAHTLSRTLDPRATSRPARDLYELLEQASDAAARAAKLRAHTEDSDDVADAFLPYGCDMICRYGTFTCVDPPSPADTKTTNRPDDSSEFRLEQLAAIANVRSEARQVRAAKIGVQATDMLIDPLSSDRSPQTTVFVHCAYFLPNREKKADDPSRCAVCLCPSPMVITAPQKHCQHIEASNAPLPQHDGCFVFCQRCMYAYELR